jgi:peptidoglycan hydrolase-like protein with peptidoglycan-binding domain
MRLTIFSISALFLASAVLCGAGPAATATKAKTKAAASSKKKSTTTKRRTSTRRRKPAGPSYQTHPTPERYKEIQQSLADKGYFKGEVNGVWGDDSTEALKRFQSDHKLPDDGKLNSLSLIQLGLGPKHESAALHPGASPEAAPELPSVTEAPAGSSEPH